MLKKVLIVISVIILIGVVGYGIYYWQKQNKKYNGPVEKITLARSYVETGALAYIAEEQGFFKDNDLDVTIKDYPSGKVAADAVIAGEADVSTSADFVFVSNSFDNPDLRVFGTIATKEVVELVARKDKGITTATDLKGKKIGVTKKSSANFDSGRFLVYNGISIADVELVDLKPLEIVEAVVNGDVDAGVTWNPNVYNIKTAIGNNAVSWPLERTFYFLLLTKEDWIKNHPAAARRFLKSVLEAENYVKEHSDEAKEVVKKKFNYEQDYMDYIWPNQEYAVVLDQAMLILFEDQARWAVTNNFTNATKVPNYLDYIYQDALKQVKPEAVTIY